MKLIILFSLFSVNLFASCPQGYIEFNKTFFSKASESEANFRSNSENEQCPKELNLKNNHKQNFELSSLDSSGKDVNFNIDVIKIGNCINERGYFTSSYAILPGSTAKEMKLIIRDRSPASKQNKICNYSIQP